MSLTAIKVTRVFRTGSTNLPDPGPNYTPNQVKDFYSNMYGFLTNFEVEGPTLANGTETYEFVKSVGTKG
jgi:PRTRC genetic system protein C